MARSNDVKADEVYWFDASKQTKRISANVSGLLGTTRISLNDNLLNRTTLPEIRAVMGHEMGHYVLNHGAKLIIEFGLVFLIGFYVLNRSYEIFLNRYGSRFSLKSGDDLAGAPVLIAILTLVFFLLTPLTNTITRTGEMEADVFGLNLAREPDGFSKVALKLSEYRKMSPSPLEEFIFYDHPSGETRIRMAMRWKKENGGL
jgi:STE24 endopeptidase